MISIDPQEIEQAQFKTTRLKEGYEADEVDNFLDRVAAELRAAQAALAAKDAEIVRLKRENAEQERLLMAYGDQAPTQVIPTIEHPPPSAAAALVLQAAQEAADKVMSQAQQEAVNITARADQNARDRADEIVADAVKRKSEITAQVDALHAKLNDHQSRRSALHQQMTDMLSRLEQDA